MNAPRDVWIKLHRSLRLSQSSIAVVLVLALFGGLLWTLNHNVRVQAARIQYIQHLGGSVVTEPSGPALAHDFVQDRLGETYGLAFRRVTAVRLKQSPVSDDDLGVLTDWDSLRQLSFNSSRVTDAGLEHLQSLPYVEDLSISNAKITDAGLSHLHDLPLEQLNLYHVPITDTGLRQISHFRNLRSLCLDETAITDRGLRELASLERLEALGLGSTHVTDEGLSNLSNLTQLEVLGLNDTDIGDVGLQELASLPKLKFLILDRTRVTDEGLRHFSGMAGLTNITLRGTRVTPAGINRLRSKLPGCRIDTDALVRSNPIE